MDFAGHADGRPFKLRRLDNQTRSDASPGSIFRTFIPLPVRRGTLPVVGEDWHSKTLAKTHVERLFSNRGVRFRGSTPVQNFCKIVDYILFSSKMVK